MPKRPLQDLQITCPGPRNKTYIIYIPIPKHVADSVKRTKKPRAAEPEKLITKQICKLLQAQDLLPVFQWNNYNK